MNGGTRKRGSTWSYYFDMGKVDGKRRKREKGGFRTRKEAEAALAKELTKYNETGAIFEPSEIRVSDYLDEWFNLYCKPNLKYSTQVNYLNIIERRIKPEFGDYKLKALTPALLQEYAVKLKMHGAAKNFIAMILSVFGSSLGYAVEPLHYISYNPMKSIRFPKVEKKPRERIILTMDEWNTIINRFRDTRYYIPLMIGFYTGLRISETFALTWDDIDFDNRTLSVNKQVVKRNYASDARKAVETNRNDRHPAAWYYSTPKTASSVRVVPFGETLYNALKKERAVQMRNELERGGDYIIHVLEKELDEKGNDLLHIAPVRKGESTQLKRTRLICVNGDGKYTSKETFRFCSRVIHEELHLAFDYHSLRHTHATMLIEAGANVKNVQTRLGHTNVQITLQTYVHDTAKMGQQSVELFERATAAKTS